MCHVWGTMFFNCFHICRLRIMFLTLAVKNEISIQLVLLLVSKAMSSRRKCATSKCPLLSYCNVLTSWDQRQTCAHSASVEQHRHRETVHQSVHANVVKLWIDRATSIEWRTTRWSVSALLSYKKSSKSWKIHMVPLASGAENSLCSIASPQSAPNCGMPSMSGWTDWCRAPCAWSRLPHFCRAAGSCHRCLLVELRDHVIDVWLGCGIMSSMSSWAAGSCHRCLVEPRHHVIDVWLTSGIAQSRCKEPSLKNMNANKRNQAANTRADWQTNLCHKKTCVEIPRWSCRNVLFCLIYVFNLKATKIWICPTKHFITCPYQKTTLRTSYRYLHRCLILHTQLSKKNIIKANKKRWICPSPYETISNLPLHAAHRQ